ncbi:MAG: hypothetical protein V7K47_06005 [Nostoc sp.]
MNQVVSRLAPWYAVFSKRLPYDWHSGACHREAPRSFRREF